MVAEIIPFQCDDVTLRASQFIEINGDFYVPIGASFYADANKDCDTDLSSECTQTFNPCTFNFENYDNSIKKIIKLGENGCSINITSMSNNISLVATDQIILMPDVTIKASPSKSVEMKIISCH